MRLGRTNWKRPPKTSRLWVWMWPAITPRRLGADQTSRQKAIVVSVWPFSGQRSRRSISQYAAPGDVERDVRGEDGGGAIGELTAQEGNLLGQHLVGGVVDHQHLHAAEAEGVGHGVAALVERLEAALHPLSAEGGLRAGEALVVPIVVAGDVEGGQGRLLDDVGQLLNPGLAGEVDHVAHQQRTGAARLLALLQVFPEIAHVAGAAGHAVGILAEGFAAGVVRGVVGVADQQQAARFAHQRGTHRQQVAIQGDGGAGAPLADLALRFRATRRKRTHPRQTGQGQKRSPSNAHGITPFMTVESSTLGQKCNAPGPAPTACVAW